MKRVGMKYCGGCNPVYDRERYVDSVRKVAGDRIDWVLYDAGGFNTVLVINGCEKECMLQELSGPADGLRVVSIRDGHAAPEEIVTRLLKPEKEKPTP
jgi:hypothetical protein